MIESIPELLHRLWALRKGTSVTGAVQWDPAALPVRRQLHQAYRQVRRLLVVRLDAIGDTFLFLDSFRKLRRLFPQAEITALAYAETRPVYERCPEVNKTLYLDREAFTLNKLHREAQLAALHRSAEPWDLVLNPLFSREYLAEQVVLAVPGRIKIGVKGDCSNMPPELTRLTDEWYSALLPVEQDVVRHELHRNNEILTLLGSDEAAVATPVPLTSTDEQWVEQLLARLGLGSFGLVFPGTKGGLASPKYWGSENYASLVDRIQLEAGLEVVLMLGGRGEEGILSAITCAAVTQPVVLAGDLSFWQAAAVLKRARFYVGSDTSLAHVAAALKIPTVVLLGGGHYGRFFPYPDGSSVRCVTRRLECFNCNWQCLQPYNKCVADIPVQEVWIALRPHLPAPSGPVARAPALSEQAQREAQGQVQHRQQSQAQQPRLVGPGARAGAPARVSRSFSRPRVDLIVPVGPHSWHLGEGMASTLRRLGWLHRVFRVVPETSAELLRYLRSGGEADLLLAIGGDHHLWYLHDSEPKRAAWHRYHGPRVCYSFESTRDSLYKKYVPRLQTALETFTHFLYSDEVDALIFERAHRPAAWWPQAADHQVFRAHTRLQDRQPRVFFCGKMWSEYPLRKVVAEALQQAHLAAFMAHKSTVELVQAYNQFVFAINPPGVLGGYNVRTFEALCCGSVLLQFLPAHRPANNALFAHGKHLLDFNPWDIQGLIALIQTALNDPPRLASLAQEGREEVLQHHTLERRLQQLIDWLDRGQAPVYPRHPAPPDSPQSAGPTAAAAALRCVNDPYLFEGRPIGNPEAPNELADLLFLACPAMIPRLCRQAEVRLWNGDQTEAIRLWQRAVDAGSAADEAHNNLGVVFWQQGEPSRALRHFEAALEVNPSYRPAVLNAGEVYRLLGQPGEAQRLYADYLKNNPADPAVRALLAEVSAENEPCQAVLSERD